MYQDYVIKKGKFIGKFEEMYKNCSDPWKYLSIGKNNIDHKIIIEFCEHIKKKINKLTILEMGCGYGTLSYQLAKKNFVTYGFDISKSAITRGKKLFKHHNLKIFVSDFDNFKKFDLIKPDIFILSDVSWYVLPKLKRFINYFKKKIHTSYIIHCLAIPENQEYGKKYFYNEKSILSFFNLKIISTANIKYFESNNINKPSEIHSFFLACNK